MSIFVDLIDQYIKADDVFEAEEVAANISQNTNDKRRARDARARNDQAYFLYAFTMLEDAIHTAFTTLINNRIGTPWEESRAWTHWDGRTGDRAHLRIKIKMLLRLQTDCDNVVNFKKERDEIAHGRVWSQVYVIPRVCTEFEQIIQRFETT